jgi:hypothetical protein
MTDAAVSAATEGLTGTAAAYVTGAFLRVVSWFTENEILYHEALKVCDIQRPAADIE